MARQMLFAGLLALQMTAVRAEVKDGKVVVYDWSPTCNMDSRGQVKDVGAAKDGVEYMAGLDQMFHLSGAKGKAECAQLSCSYNSAIMFCNDHPDPIDVHSSDVAGLAFSIFNTCNQGSDSWKFNGQAFNQSEKWNWNVIIEASMKGC